MKRACVALALAALSSVQASAQGTLDGRGAWLPPLLESASSGKYAALMDVIGAHYGGGKIRYQVVPIMRMHFQVAAGQADFGFPVMKIAGDGVRRAGYRYTRARVGVVTFVLYSRASNPLSREQLLAAAAERVPYAVEAPPGHWGFPTKPNFQTAQALKKIALGRLDGLVMAQEEADATLRQLGLTGIRRAHFADFDEVLIVPRSSRGDEVDRALSGAIDAAARDGSLQRAYARLHRPYDDWQPAATVRAGQSLNAP